MKNLFKNLICVVLMLVLMSGGFLFPKKVRANNATQTITKEFGALAGAYMAVPVVCKGYAESSEIGRGLIEKGKDWVKSDTVGKVWNKVTGWFKDKTKGAESGSNAVPTQDDQARETIEQQERATRIERKEESCKNFLRDVVLQSYKKRLMDKLVDDIIAWINGETKEPRFVNNPESIFQEARNEAIGDVVLETQYADLCYDNLDVKLKLELTKQEFSESVKCTLDDVVNNLTAFKDNFQEGGWIAYQESLKPRNNPAGISFLTQQELINRTNQKENITNYEATVGSGFLGAKKCSRWEEKPGVMVDPVPAGCSMTSQGKVYCDASISGATNDGSFIYDNKTPDTGVNYTGKTSSPGGSAFRCVESETVTPGQVAAESMSKAIGSEFDFIINAEDLSTYGAAIMDAAISRIAKMGSEGLAYMTQSEEEKSCDDFKDPYLKDLCKRNQGSPTKQKEPENYDLKQMWSDASTTLTIAKDSWKSASSTNYKILNTLDQVKECRENNNISTDKTNTEIETAKNRRETIDSKLNVKAVGFDERLENIKSEVENGGANAKEIKKSLENVQSDLESFLKEAATEEDGLKNQIQPKIEKDLQTCISQSD